MNEENTVARDALDLEDVRGSGMSVRSDERNSAEASSEKCPEGEGASLTHDAGKMPPRTPMVLVAVRLRPNWPPFHYDAGSIPVTEGEWVVVPTEHGIEVGQVVGKPCVVTEPADHKLVRIKRLASTHEIEKYYRNLERESRAREVGVERIRALALSMKLIRVESFFEGGKIVFYYSAESRVDFRELVRELVKALHARVEMRQIGIRHEAKMVGGVGNCGRELCCSGFLKTFDPVSIKMAKAQNLPLNPSKISGLCGRLLCCLTYEYQAYVDMRKNMPPVGKTCKTPAGEGKVIRHNVLRQTVTVALQDGAQAEFTLAELERRPRQKEGAAPSSSGRNGGSTAYSHAVSRGSYSRKGGEAGTASGDVALPEVGKGKSGKEQAGPVKARPKKRSGGKRGRPRGRKRRKRDGGK